VDLAPPFGTQRIAVRTATEMREALLRVRAGADAVFMAAAVADYVPRAAAVKLKKHGAPLTLTLDEAPDILAELGSRREERLLVGFAAETGAAVENARDKLRHKNLDFIVANDVSQPGIGFDADENAVTIVGRTGEVWEVPRATKAEVAEAILDRVFGATP
jgi:phosphopantothenoylcysteine decarboxylase/phosphopantothenate--cysteine ligase